jgi:hypothetical protein
MPNAMCPTDANVAASAPGPFALLSGKPMTGGVANLACRSLSDPIFLYGDLPDCRVWRAPAVNALRTQKQQAACASAHPAGQTPWPGSSRPPFL